MGTGWSAKFTVKRLLYEWTFMSSWQILYCFYFIVFSFGIPRHQESPNSHRYTCTSNYNLLYLVLLNLHVIWCHFWTNCSKIWGFLKADSCGAYRSFIGFIIGQTNGHFGMTLCLKEQYSFAERKLQLRWNMHAKPTVQLGREIFKINDHHQTTVHTINAFVWKLCVHSLILPTLHWTVMIAVFYLTPFYTSLIRNDTNDWAYKRTRVTALGHPEEDTR